MRTVPFISSDTQYGTRRNADSSHLQRILKYSMMPRKIQTPSSVKHIQGNFSLIPSLFPLSAVQVKLICKWLRFWASTHFLPVHRLKGRAHTQVTVFQRSHARSSCPPPESCHVPGSCHSALPGQARTQSTLVVLWKTKATALEITGISYSRPPRKGTKRTDTFFRKYTALQSTLFITNGLPCLCFRNKKKEKKQEKKVTLRSYFKTFFCKT